MRGRHRRRTPVRTRGRGFTLVLSCIAIAAMFMAVAIPPAYAIPVTVTDDAGPDDEPGQKDLNQLTIDAAPSTGFDIEVTWNWDVISLSGANTGDACSLYDTDDDGMANFALCVVWDNGATYQTTVLYSCGDDNADRCSQPADPIAEDTDQDGVLEAITGGPYSSTCGNEIALVDDTFGTRTGAQASDTQDTQAACSIDLDDFGGADTATLLNVCSYPSGQPNSDPSDCIFNPNSGFLTIVKVADPDDSTNFQFDLGGGQEANNGDTSWTIQGSGSVQLIGFAAGTEYDLSEVVPSGWSLDDAECELSDGSSTGTWSGSTITDFEIQVGRETTCTFTNTELATLTLVKVVDNDNGGTAVATDWTLTADGTGSNDISGAGGVGPSNVAPDTFALSESGGPTGYTASAWSCPGYTLGGTGSNELTLAAGESATCTITNTDDAPSLILAKDVNNDNGGSAVESDFTLYIEQGDPGEASVTGSVSGAEVTDQAGTYDLSESGPANYSLTSLTCDNAVGQVTQVTLALGETVTCTFVNDDDAPSLILAKDVNNDNGGSAVESDFTLYIEQGDPGEASVTGSVSGAEVTDQAGTYDLSESGPANYSLTSLTCDNAVGQVTQVTLALGETVTCTFVNDDDAPSLILAKDVNNDNGGSAVESDFTLYIEQGDPGEASVTGSVSGAEVTDQAGTYDLSESGPANYSLTSLTCDNAVGQVTQVTLALGETVTCTFVNDDDAPSLILAKDVNNDNGGSAVESDFTLYIEQGDPGEASVTGSVSGAEVTDQAGTYDLSESGPANYSLTSLTCDNAVGQVTQVTLALGETVTCTFVNDDDAPSLILAKDVNNDNGGSAVESDFTLYIEQGDPGEASVTGSVSGAEVTDQAGTYDLSESGPANYSLTSLTCDNAVGQVTQVTLALGETVTCTFVNDDDAPSLTLIKVVDNGLDETGTAVAADWTLTASGPTGFSGTTGVSSGASFDQGTYDLSESGPSGYTASDWVCTGTGSQTDGDTIVLALGESATCTITNEAQGKVRVTKTFAGGAIPSGESFSFELRSGASVSAEGTILATDTADSSNPVIDFGGLMLDAGTYQLCETGMLPGWHSSLSDLPGAFIPNSEGVPDPDNSIVCVDVVVGIGEIVDITVDNTPPPGGDARTIGFWKNWTSCDGHGNQAPILDETLAAAPGGSILIGDLVVDTCEEAVSILDKRDLMKGKKQAGDAAYGLAAQLLAYELNQVADAGFCAYAEEVADAAQQLLADANFDGKGNYWKGGKNAADQKALANFYAGILDLYNNNDPALNCSDTLSAWVLIPFLLGLGETIRRKGLEF